MSTVIAVLDQSSQPTRVLGFYAGGWIEGQPTIRLAAEPECAQAFGLFSRKSAKKTAVAMYGACAEGARHSWNDNSIRMGNSETLQTLGFAPMSRTDAAALVNTGIKRRFPPITQAQREAMKQHFNANRHLVAR